jgi:integrase
VRPDPLPVATRALAVSNVADARPPRPTFVVPDSYESSDDDEDDDEFSIVQKKRAAIEMSLHAKREAYLTDIFKLNGDVVNGHHRLAFMSVAPTTFDQYCSTWNRLLDFGRQHSLPTPHISYVNFSRYLAFEKTAYANSSFDTMRSAVSLYVRAMSQLGPEPQMIATLRGRQYSNIDCLIGKRGAITRPMLLELLALPEIPKDYKDWFVILGASGLRRNQLMSLRFSHCKYDPSLKPPAWVLLAERNFKGRAGRLSKKGAALEEHICNPAWNAELTRIFKGVEQRKSSTNPDPIVGFDFKPNWGLEYLKFAAAELWDEDLWWVLHGFRHGAAAEAFLKFGNQSIARKLLEVQKVTGHITYDMLRHYSQQNEDRLFLVRAQASQVMAKNFSLGGRVALFESKLVKVGRTNITLAGPDETEARKEVNCLLRNQKTANKVTQRKRDCRKKAVSPPKRGLTKKQPKSSSTRKAKDSSKQKAKNQSKKRTKKNRK